MRSKLVTLPYTILLSRRARETLNIDLRNQIVIIDEAHSKIAQKKVSATLMMFLDLIDAILQLHSVELTITTIRSALVQLRAYLQRFRTRLTMTHALNLKRLVLFLTSLEQFVTGNAHTGKSNNGSYQNKSVATVPVTAFVESLGTNINGLNLVELQTYLVSSKVNILFTTVSKFLTCCEADRAESCKLCKN